MVNQANHRRSREVFRRTGLAVAPEWAMAASVTLVVSLSAHHFGLRGGWEGAVLMSIPVLWAGARTLQWLCYTWTVNADGCLVIGKGVLLRSRQVIHLCSASQVRTGASPERRLLRTGDISFEATGQDGLRRRFHWTWVRGHARLGEIIRARGRLPIGRPARWQTARDAIGQGVQATLRSAACARNRAALQDYGRFMAFCNRVLRADRSGRWPLDGVRPVLVEYWMEVLQEAGVVSGVPDGHGWRVARGIESLDDIRQRIGPNKLAQAVEQSARFQWRRAA